MSLVSNIIKKFLLKFFNKSTKKNLDFFSKPKALVVLQIASLAILNPLLSRLKELLKKKSKNSSIIDSSVDIDNLSDNDIKNYVKNNRDLQNVLDYVGRDLDESIASDITLACSDPEYYVDQTKRLKKALGNKELSGNDFIKIAKKESDFDEKVNNSKIGNLERLLSKIIGILPWLFLIYILILKIKEFLTQNDYPSKYRGKYLQRLIRTIAKILKKVSGEVKGEISEFINMLKSLDSIIVASLMATFVYLTNRKQLQEESFKSFSSIASSITCENIENPISNEDSHPDFKPYDESNVVICPIEEEPMVPHEPFKISNENLNSCEVVQGSPMTTTFVDEGNFYDIATKAIFENTSLLNFNILVSKKQVVNTQTTLGTLGDVRVHSPINGIVHNIESNKIIISDISDSGSMILEELIKESQDLYKELNDTKYFIKDFYVNSWYPIMLRESPLIDASISAAEFGNIRYFTGGVWERFEVVQKNADERKENYEKTISNIAGKDNVKQKAENEELGLIKEEIDIQDKVYYKELRNITSEGKSQAQMTLPKEEEFAAIDYFFDLYTDVFNLWDQNEIVVPFRDELNKILIERFFIDEWNQEKLSERVNSLCNELSEGTFFEDTPNFFIEMLNRYNSNKKLKSVKGFISSLGKDNESFTEYEKEKIINKIMFIFDFVLQILQKIESNYVSTFDRYEIVIKEANFIENYFNQLWKRYENIPGELKEIYKKLDELEYTLTTYSIVTIDDEQYRYYGLGKERECPIPDTDGDEYSSPFSESEYGQLKYWLKYCAITTLIGITNFPLGWSTGFPPPFGPIPFPVVYIPIKAFQLNWGFIVIGITITGIYPFPWVLFTNFSTNYHVPLADPASLIKKQVRNLKKSLTNKFKTYRQSTLKEYMTKTKKEIIITNEKIDSKTKERRIHKLEKPRRDRTKKNNRIIYTKELKEWNSIQRNYDNELLTLKNEKYKLEIRYKIVYNAYSGAEVEDNSDTKIKSMKKTEESIDKQFEKLDKLIDSINIFLAPLPITSKPETANFGFTIKNPKPIIKFGDELNDNINNGVLDPIVEKFEFKNKDLMSTNYNSKLDNTVVNWKKYTSALRGAMPTIIKKDPFPKYEHLKVTNLPWISFLYKDWTRIGAQTYGFPIFPPLPTS